MFIKQVYYTLLRLSRNWIGSLILIGIPLALITLIGFIAKYSYTGIEGVRPMDWISIGFVFSFQLYGGAYVMEYVKEDLTGSKKWRLFSLPIYINKYLSAIFFACTLFSILQGFIMVLFTKWVYDVNWGNLFIVLIILCSISFLSQAVCLVFVLSVKNFKVAERLSEVYGIGSMLLAGMMFNLPDNKFFKFMYEYGTPISLARNSTIAMITGSSIREIILPIAILITLSILLSMVGAYLGRRRFA